LLPSALSGDGTSVEPHTVVFPIFAQVSDEESRLVGTGFFLTTVGHFVTAKHVVSDILNEQGQGRHGHLHIVHFVRGAEVLVRHVSEVVLLDDFDLAVGHTDFRVDTASGKPFKNRVPVLTTVSPPSGSAVVTLAYPETTPRAVRGTPGAFVATYYHGEFVRSSDLPRDANLVSWPYFETTLSTRGGTSGGPVFDARGRVFGVNCVGGITGLSHAGRIADILGLRLPKGPGESSSTVLELAHQGAIAFDPLP
jgi:hypothetical protein